MNFCLFYSSKSSVYKTGVTINYVLQLILAGLFFINTIFHIYSYLKRVFSLPVISVSPTQKKLMGIQNSGKC